VQSLFDEVVSIDRESLRVPPHSIEAESSLLGALMLDNEAWDQVSEMLTESDFYRHEHRLIFRSLANLINSDKPADVITVFEELRLQGKDLDFGGLPYLNQLAQYVPSAGNIKRYVLVHRLMS
jgi:replicative DNA helicase